MEIFFGESSAVGDQKVCIRSLHKFKFNMQTFWNTNRGGKTAGRYSVGFNGSNLASRVYYYKFEAGNISQVRKLILLKINLLLFLNSMILYYNNRRDLFILLKILHVKITNLHTQTVMFNFH